MDELREAIKELRVAENHFDFADAEHIDVAIMEVDAARGRVSAAIRREKANAEQDRERTGEIMQQMEITVTIHRGRQEKSGQAARRRSQERSFARWARKNAGSIVWYFFLTLAGIVLYKLGAAYALQQRGYYAIGGEALALLLPVLWYVCYTTIRDFARDICARF